METLLLFSLQVLLLIVYVMEILLISLQVLFRLEFEFRPVVVLDHVRVDLEASRWGVL